MRTMIVALLLLVLGALLPGRAAAGDLQTVGCAAQGYTIQILNDPSWHVVGNCSPAMVVQTPNNAMILVVKVEAHGWWNDARSRSSITNDLGSSVMRMGGTETDGVGFSVLTIHGHRFFTGITKTVSRDGVDEVVLIAETFYTGYMYKFACITDMGDNGVKVVGLLWSTIHLYPRA